MSKFEQQNAGRVISPEDTVNVPRLSKRIPCTLLDTDIADKC